MLCLLMQDSANSLSKVLFYLWNWWQFLHACCSPSSSSSRRKNLELMSQRKLPPPVLRRMPEYAGQVFREMYSTQRRRDSVMSILADAVGAADSLAPGSWGVTLDCDRLCLNVGRGASLQLYSDRIFFVVTRSMLYQVDSRAMGVFEDNDSYKYIPDNAEGIISIGQLKYYSAFRKAHFDAIVRAT